jgi:uncharacterized coiled-coil protein SlyX
MENDLRGRVVSLEHKSAAQETRLTGLEVWRTERDIERARHDERWKHMDEKIDKIANTLGRINWMVIAGIVAAFLGFLFKGGFAP